MAKAIAVPTAMMFKPGTTIVGANNGVEWIWVVALAGPDIPNGPSGGENVSINVVGADTLATARDKLQQAIIALASRRYGATVTGPDILMAQLAFGV